MDSDTRKCPSCGAEQPSKSVFCGECGAKMSDDPNGESLAPPVKEQFYDRYGEAQRNYYSPPQADPQDVPLSMGDYLIMIIAFCVPIVGLVLMIVWSLSSTANTNRKNFSRAMLIVTVIGFILSIIASIFFAGLIAAVWQEMSRQPEFRDFYSYFDSYFDMSIIPHIFH